MTPQRWIPPRIRWSDGSEGLELPETPADRVRLGDQRTSRFATWQEQQRLAWFERQAPMVQVVASLRQRAA
jgi:hypothetical protein